ncbi:hypothetical protein ADEAN_000870500 [Angomonas deanei]|uniref:Uncharacterized protein n=1 Tax=Angomonas deanei TaxID=59799 RepID=A0A7G2CQC6_9TRYP|nr:hypothetical protein ADEAN_000870500 [Angomonas deanei]
MSAAPSLIPLLFQFCGGFCVAQVFMPFPPPDYSEISIAASKEVDSAALRFIKKVSRNAHPPETLSMEEDIVRFQKEYPWRMVLLSGVIIVMGGTSSACGAAANLYIRGEGGKNHYVQVKQWIHKTLIE